MFVTRRRIGRTGALLGTWCGATGPQEPAEPVKAEQAQSRPGIGYSARKTAATEICRVSRIRTARRGFTFPAPDRAVRRGYRWPAHGAGFGIAQASNLRAGPQELIEPLPNH